MKKLAAILLTLTLLICPTLTSAQNSPGATSSSPQAVNRSAVIKRLLAEIDDSRSYVEKLERRERALTDEISKADKAHDLLSEAYSKSLIEIGSLRATIQHEKNALAELEKELARVRAQRDEALKENSSLKRENRYLKLGYALLVAAKLLL